MAILYFNLSHITRTSQRPSATRQAAYILRRASEYRALAAAQGWDTRRIAAPYGEDLLASEAGNVPPWAEGSVLAFFLAAERYERANGRIASSLVVSLPRELPLSAQVAMMQTWCTLQYADHPYVYALHHTISSFGELNPHAHLLYSIRTNDAYDRPPAQYFARYNASQPDRGGARKDPLFDAYGVVRAQRYAWSDLVNWSLATAGHTAFADPRSLHVREIPRTPEPVVPSYYGYLAKYRGVITPAWQAIIDARADQTTKPLEQEKAREWWAYRQTLLGLRVGVSTPTEVLGTLRANQRLETAQFAHPGHAGLVPAAHPLTRHQQAVRAALTAYGAQRMKGHPPTAEMEATARRLGLQTEYIMRSLRVTQERTNQDRGFGT